MMALSKILIIVTFICMGQFCHCFLGSVFGPNSSMVRMIFGRPSSNIPGRRGSSERTDPAICARRACVNYTVISRGQEYEHRRYEEVAIAVTDRSSTFMSKMSVYRRLSRYLKGGNTEKTRLNMTYPVLSRVGGVQSNLSMIAMLPTDLPPKALSTLVRLDTLPAMEVYVRPFSGNSFGTEGLEEEVTAFREVLANRAPRLPADAFLAEYNKPFSIFNRYSEIWLVSKYMPKPQRTTQVPVDGVIQPQRQQIGGAADGEKIFQSGLQPTI